MRNASVSFRSALTTIALHLIPLLTFLILWEAIVHHIERGTFFYSSPNLVARAIWQQIVSGQLLRNSTFTLAAVLSGFLLGNIAGIVAGTGLSYSRSIARVASTYLVIAGSVPVLAFAPMIIIWFGIGIGSKIALATFSTGIVAAAQTFQGAAHAPASAVALLESLGASRWQVFRKVVIPSSLVWLFSGLKLNIGVAILAVFIGEFISAEAGLGYQIVLDMGLFKTSSVLAGVVVISVLSLLLNTAVDFFQRILMPWLKMD